MTKKQAISMLNQIKKMAIDASMTGELEGGASYLKGSYNKIYDYAVKQNWIDAEFIAPITDEMLNPDAEWMDVVGCAATMLKGFLETEEE